MGKEIWFERYRVVIPEKQSTWREKRIAECEHMMAVYDDRNLTSWMIKGTE